MLGGAQPETAAASAVSLRARAAAVHDQASASRAAPSSPAMAPATGLSDIHIDQQRVDRMRARWERDVKPHEQALRDAAQAQYEVISSLRREQQRLIDEADRIQRLIDDLEKQYQEMTTPRPEGNSQ